MTQFRKSVPPNVAAAVAKALEKLPADRFESAKAFSDALANASFTTAAVAGAVRDAGRAEARRVAARLRRDGGGGRRRDEWFHMVIAPADRRSLR